METTGTSCLVGIDEYLRYVGGRVVRMRRARELYERVRTISRCHMRNAGNYLIGLESEGNLGGVIRL